MNRKLAFYITGHGFGHASRVVEVINALLTRDPALNIYIRTSAPRWLFDLTVAGLFSYEHCECDPGIVQIDSLRLHEDASVSRAVRFMASFEDRAAREAARLRELQARLVVADVPALGIAAGARAGVPAVVLANFTWDWIYSAYPDTEHVVDGLAAAYSQAALALRLPMWGGFSALSTIIDLPFVARHSMRAVEETRTCLGVAADTPLVFPSFGGYGLEGLDRVPWECDGYAVISSVDETRLYAEGFRHEDLVRAADVVVTKPGYGIIAECLANNTAILYTDRGRFIEYDVLVAAMPRFLRCAYIDHADLFAGRWQGHLEKLLAQPAPPERPATNGAEVAADVLLRML
jgi:hypothetical protein